MSAADYLPANRREVLMCLATAAVSLGASMVPGVTLEPAAATECRVSLAACEERTQGLQAALLDMEGSRTLAWCRYRECSTGEDQDCRRD